MKEMRFTTSRRGLLFEALFATGYLTSIKSGYNFMSQAERVAREEQVQRGEVVRNIVAAALSVIVVWGATAGMAIDRVLSSERINSK